MYEVCIEIAPHTLHDPCVLVLDWFVVFLPYNRVFLENVLRCFEALQLEVQVQQALTELNES